MGQTRNRQIAVIDAQIGRRLRQIRQERGITLAALASMMGHASGQAVSKYEQGAGFPAALMVKTAAALRVPVSAFFDGLEEGLWSETVSTDEPFVVGAVDDSAEARKIMLLLRQAPRSLHPMILRVVRAILD